MLVPSNDKSGRGGANNTFGPCGLSYRALRNTRNLTPGLATPGQKVVADTSSAAEQRDMTAGAGNFSQGAHRSHSRTRSLLERLSREAECGSAAPIAQADCLSLTEAEWFPS
jgi:hypothetical protein